MKMKTYMTNTTIIITRRKTIEAKNKADASQMARDERNDLILDILSNYKFKQGQWAIGEAHTDLIELM